MGDQPKSNDELGELIAAATDQIETPEGAPVVELRRRARGRVRRRRTLATVASAAVVALGAVAAVQLVQPADQEVFVAEPPVIEDQPLGTSPGHLGEWAWHDVDTMSSRTGSAAGYGTRTAPGAEDLLIYLTDEGVCLDATSCVDARADFGADELAAEYVGTDGGPAAGLIGDGAPFEAWNVAVVPGVTGDLFVGRSSAVAVPGVSATQRFEGAANLEVVLNQLAQMDPSPARVVLAGSGNAGLGALLTTRTVEQLAGDRLVGVIADGGAVPSPQLPPACVVRGWAKLWGVGFPEDWAEHVAKESESRLSDFYAYLASRYPDIAFAQLTSTDDARMRSLARTGSDQCDRPLKPVSPESASQAVLQLDDRLAGLDGWDSFVVDEPTSSPTSLPGGSADVPGFDRWLRQQVGSP